MVFTLMTGVYLHTAYAQASDGSVGFSTTSATDAAYLGQYTDASAADATDPGRYAWTPIDLGEGAELVEGDEAEVDDGTDGLIDLLDRELYDTGQFAPDAQATGDRKVQTYFQADEPDPEEYVFGVGDLWHDTDDGNHLYRWDGTAWVDAQDGGIGAATELAQAAGTTAEEVQTALDGLTKVQDGQVLIDGDKVYLSAAFVKSIFAQDITATGTITGAQLVGAILSGNAIDIQAVIDATSIGLKTELVDNSYCLVLSASGGTTKGEITLSRGVLKLFGQSLLELATDELYINADTITDAHYSAVTYTSFSGGVLSSGSVVVTKKLGMCYISGTVALSKSISAWTTILSSSKVPAPQHGELVPFEASQWGTSYARPLRGKVTPAGGIQLVYGAAGNYVFTIAYPIN